MMTTRQQQRRDHPIILHALFPLLGLPLARNLPFGLPPDRLAAAALGEDGWSAGAGLMRGANPQQWSAINESLLRSEAAGDELKTCVEAAKKTGKEQRCVLTLRPAPLPGR